ncbi:hypothetical protein DFH06DRAFT_1081967 [Mycena polygramma]|nr:hypothetical protein DFH06DRAFT_1081967 [Mycena polygramma]
MGRRQRPNHRGGKRSRQTPDEAQQPAVPATKSPRQKNLEAKPGKPRDPKRGRSEAARARHTNRYLTPGGVFDNGQRYWRENTVSITRGRAYPTAFLSGAKNGKNARRVIRKQFPGKPADWPLFCDDSSKIVLVSSPPPTEEDLALSGVGGIGKWLEPKLGPRALTALKELGPAPFDVARFPAVISKYDQGRLVDSFTRLMELEPTFHLKEENLNRSEQPALHLGVWERYTAEGPMLTADSRQVQAPVHRRKELMHAMHDLCGVLKEVFLTKVASLIEWYYPEAEWIREAMHKRILENLGDELAEFPNFDFGGILTTVACKEGGSEMIHLDWFDNLNLPAWLTAVGDFEGGNFCAPQLDGAMGFEAGSVVAAKTRMLAHCCSPVTGRRIVFTFFIDQCLFEKTMAELN